MERRKVSTAHSAFIAELNRLQRMDDLNQERYAAGAGRPGRERLSANQMHLLTEAIFTRAFSKYEEFIEQIFILYCLGKRTTAGASVRAFIRPKSAVHARMILKSGMNFLEWNAPEKILDRCDTYLHADSPIFFAISTHQDRLSKMRRVRNAIAHSSDEALTHFRKVVRAELNVAPLKNIAVGEFLIMSDLRSLQAQHFLKSYLGVLARVADIAAG